MGKTYRRKKGKLCIVSGCDKHTLPGQTRCTIHLRGVNPKTIVEYEDRYLRIAKVVIEGRK